MTCRDFIDFLWRYVAEELPPDERLAFDAHLAVCPDCVDYLRSYRETVRLGKDAFPPDDSPVPEEVPEDLVRAILATQARGGSPRRR